MSESGELKARFVRDNGDGTETWLAPVIVRSDVIKGHEIVWVRKTRDGDNVIDARGGDIYAASRNDAGCLRIIVRPIPKPTWKPPASLKPGRYFWHGCMLWFDGRTTPINARCLFRDWTDPPAVGWWVVSEDGTASYEGE